jgi:hypothetical protein
MAHVCSSWCAGVAMTPSRFGINLAGRVAIGRSAEQHGLPCMRPACLALSHTAPPPCTHDTCRHMQ